MHVTLTIFYRRRSYSKSCSRSPPRPAQDPDWQSLCLLIAMYRRLPLIQDENRFQDTRERNRPESRLPTGSQIPVPSAFPMLMSSARRFTEPLPVFAFKCHALRDPPHSFAILLIEQLIHDLLAVAEIRSLDLIECISQVKESSACTQGKHPKRSDHAKSFVARYPHSIAVIHEQQIGRKRSCQSERGSLSIRRGSLERRHRKGCLDVPAPPATPGPLVSSCALRPALPYVPAHRARRKE